MPTLICVDVSLSMQRKVEGETLLNLTLSSLKTFMRNIHNQLPHEYISLVEFSDIPTLLVPFTKTTSSLLDKLSDIAPSDRGNIENLMSMCERECSQWNIHTPSHIVLVTDSIPRALQETLGLFPLACTVSIIAMKPGLDAATKTQAFLTSCNLQGKLYPGPVLGLDGLERIFETVLLDHYNKTEVKLCFGNHQTSLQITPPPDLNLLTKISGSDTPPTFPSTLSIHGFLAQSVLHHPPYTSRHFLYQTSTKSTKTPDLRVVLHDALKSKELVGLVDIGEGWFGVISAWSQKTETEKVAKQSNLCLSIIAPNSFTWLGDLKYLALSRLLPPNKVQKLPYKEPYPNSYDNKTGPGMVWAKTSTLQVNIQKVIRYAKKLPEKSTAIFLKELNKVRRSILFYGFNGMLDVVCKLLEKEMNDDNSVLLNKCIEQIKTVSDPHKTIHV